MSEFVDQRELRGAVHRRARLEAARVPRPRPPIVIAAVSLLVCAAVALAVVQARAPENDGGAAHAGAVNAQIISNFAQFRRPHTAADALPAGTASSTLSCFGPAAQTGPHAAAIEGLGTAYQLQCVADQQPAIGGRGPLEVAPTHLSPRQRSAVHRTVELLDRVIAGLQRRQSRAVKLPGALGTIWLIPSHRWLCGLMRSRTLFHFPGHSSLVCEPVAEVTAQPPLWVGGIYDGYLIALEPDRVTKVTLAYRGGSEPTYLAHNVLGACVGIGSSWLKQTGPRIRGAIKTSLGGGSVTGAVEPYRSVRCPRLPR